MQKTTLKSNLLPIFNQATEINFKTPVVSEIMMLC